MMHVGDTMSTVGGVQYRGGIPSFENLSTVGDIMIHVGGCHEYHGGCSVPWGTKRTKDFPPHGTEHPPQYS